MKTKQLPNVLACLFVLLTAGHRAAAQNTSFTYQGRLTANGAPPAGSSDLTFTLYDAAGGGNVIGGPLTNSAASDANGIFTVTLDFGSAPFAGQPRWLQIGVRPSGGGAFTPLTPRQQLTADPYALYAATPTVQGQPGTPGSVWREGSGAPSNATGIDGDYYLDGSTGNVYLRSSGAYAVVANLKGAQGQPGLVALPFSGGVTTNIAAFKVTNAGGDAIDAFTATGYGVFGQANSPGGWGGLFRYGSDGNNSAYLGSSSGAGIFYGNTSVNGSTSGVLFEAKNSGSGNYGVSVKGDSPSNGAYGQLGVSVPGIDPGSVVSYGVYGNGGSGGSAAQFDGTVTISGTLYSGAISGGAVSGSSFQAGPASPYGASLSAIGTRTGFYNQPIAYIENQNTSSGSSPALRVVSSGDSPYGALSVSQQGTGLIAQFGNASAFVSKLDSAGNWCGTSFVGCSDRNVKENFRNVNAREVLEKVAALPITRWNFKADVGTEHLGPMSQDFYSAFRIGPDDKHIASVDADGVALAAVQGLNQKVEEQGAALRAKDQQIHSLEQRLRKLETLVEQFSQ